MLSKLIAIVGPTASGKTALGLRLARKFNGEIISADSRQVYRELDIGTDKIAGELKEIPGELGQELGERGVYLDAEGIPHYLISIVSPDKVYSLAEYKADALKIIKDIQARGKTPFLVGGTGLYISAIIDNYEMPTGEPNWKLREELGKMSNEELLAKLKKLDQETAEVIDGKNKRRLIRALEVCLTTGRTFYAQKSKGEKIFDSLQIGLVYDKEALPEKIFKRLEEQFERGVLDEAEKASKKYGWESPAMTGISCREFREYFAGTKNLEWVKKEIFKANKKYAKRQMTWFKRDQRINWINSAEEAEELASEFLRKGIMVW